MADSEVAPPMHTTLPLQSTFASNRQAEATNFKALGWPFRKGQLNPYTTILYESMPAKEVTVAEARPRRILRRHDVLHIHWPEHLLRGSSPFSQLVKPLAYLSLLIASQARGAVVKFTVQK
jgi:hypothetical protein